MIKNNKLITFFILLIVFSEFYKLPYNSYLLIKRPYEERMISNYGYCDKEGYGYIKFIINKFNIDKKNLTIINKNPTPGIYGLLKLTQNENANNVVLINFHESVENKIINQKIKKKWFDDERIDLSKFKLINRYGNCFYLKKK